VTEVVVSGTFSLKKVSRFGNYVLLVGKLEKGDLAIGWKVLVNGKTAEVTDIGISSIDREIIDVTVQGITPEDLTGKSSLEFKTEIL